MCLVCLMASLGNTSSLAGEHQFQARASSSGKKSTSNVCEGIRHGDEEGQRHSIPGGGEEADSPQLTSPHIQKTPESTGSFLGTQQTSGTESPSPVSLLYFQAL